MKNKNYILFAFFFSLSILYSIENIRIAVIPQTKENMVTMLITGTGYELDSKEFLFSLPTGSDSVFTIQTNQSNPIRFVPKDIYKENKISWIKVKKNKPSFAFMINVFPEKNDNYYYFDYNMNFSTSIDRLEFEIREPKNISNFNIMGLKQTTKVEERDAHIYIGILENLSKDETRNIKIEYSVMKIDELLNEKDFNENIEKTGNAIEPKNNVIKRYKLYTWESLISVLIIFIFSVVIIKINNLNKKEEY